MQRWQGTLEMLMLAPRPPALLVFPITLATAVSGTYAMMATLAWGRLVYGIPLDVADPVGFAVAVPAVILGLGMFGLLLASTFVLMHHANALNNTLEYPIWLVSGMLVPITVLPAWSGPIGAVLPTTWAARAVREAATGDGAVWPALGVCLAISAVCLAAGALTMSYVERRARVNATLALA
jgi:ABC-type multidrug transport system permease subunit